MELYLENLKNMKEQYERKYSNNHSLDPSNVVYKSLLAERIMQEQDYIIKMLLEERMTIKS